MRKAILTCLALITLTITWGSNSSAGLLRRRARRCPPPVCATCYTAPTYAAHESLSATATNIPGLSHPRPGTPAALRQAAGAGGRFRTPWGTTHTFTLKPALQHEEVEHGPGLTAAAHGPSDGEHFNGSARKVAKTSIAEGSPETFNSPGELIDALLGGQAITDNDALMRSKIGTASAPRVGEEQRNVTLKAFLYATKKESDNDFHLLIGPDPGAGNPRFMTAEISGLPVPNNSSTPSIQAARGEFKSFFLGDPSSGLTLPVSGHYTVFDQPIPVTLTGSIFFDLDHHPGDVGTQGIVPATVWEVHPITEITFPNPSSP